MDRNTLTLYNIALTIDPDKLQSYECKIVWIGKPAVFMYLDKRGNDVILLKQSGQSHEEGLVLWHNIETDPSKPGIWRAATRGEYDQWVERTKANVSKS